MMKKWQIMVMLLLMAMLVAAVGFAAQDAVTYGGGIVYEAEDAVLENVDIAQEFHEGGKVEGYSGTGFVGAFDNTDGKPSTLTFAIDVPEDGSYDLVFYTCSPHGQKYNHIRIDERDNMHEALMSPQSMGFQAITIPIELTAGEHTVRVIEGWGFVYVDALVVKKQEAAVKIPSISSPPVNQQASSEAVALKSYLNECYGNFVLSGQYADGINAPEIQAIYKQTGKYPAIMGFDFIYAGKTAQEHKDFVDLTLMRAIEWSEKGGIVTFCWHWLAPKDNHLSDDHPWDKSFYTQATGFDLRKAMSGEDEEGYAMLLADIDTVSEQLKVLRDAGIPVLWRPLHEASGGWFWWGNAGAQAYKDLWNLLYDRMVNFHGLDNLLWVWNGQHNDKDAFRAWYPGNDTVDIIGEDIYPDKRDHASQVERFAAAQTYTSENKIVALTETGSIPDPDMLKRDGALWAWFAPWYREFVVDMDVGYQEGLYSDEYTSLNMLRKVYEHELVITLDELPSFQ